MTQINNILTTKELAKYLKLNEKTVIKMAQNGHLPGVKIGNQWRFHLKAIDNYLLRDIIEASDEELNSVIDANIDIMPLSRLTGRDLIELNSEAGDIEQVLSELASIAHKAGLTASEGRLFNELQKREEILSTAIGNGIAIPHARHPSPELFKQTKLVILRSGPGVDFNAPDGKPVNIFFMICAPSEAVHIRLLARLAKFLHIPDMIKELMQAQNKDEVARILLRFDREYMFPARDKESPVSRLR
jgi:PTS system nitrogen regulatory IIA component